MTWQDPSWYALILLAVLPLMAWRLFSRQKTSAVRYSSTSVLQTVRPTLKSRLAGLPPILRIAALATLVIALARPQKGDEQTSVTVEGVAIQLLIDRSSSMLAHDLKVGNTPVDRLTAIHHVAHDFVLGANDMPGRPNDLIGLIAFARFPDSRCPQTLDHNYLMETIKNTQIVHDQSEDGTAIGEALALGVERLRDLDRTRGQSRKIKSKIMILLTDGQNNAGDIDPFKAADLAARYGIKVYTIGVGTKGLAPYPVQDPFTGQKVLRPVEVNIDEDALKKISEKTGGKYFRAYDTDSLRRIYAEIDKLEKTRTEQKVYTDYKELALEPIRVAGVMLPPLLWCGLALLGLEVLLSTTWLRRVN